MKALISYRAILTTAIVAAVFSALVCVLLLVDASNRLAKVPLDAPQFVALREQFVEEPNNDALREEIRNLDFALRQEYFREQQFTETGSYLLLGGIALTLIMGKWAATIRRKLPAPKPKESGPDSDERLSRSGLWAVAVLILALFGTTWAMKASSPSALPATLEELAALREQANKENEVGEVADNLVVTTEPAVPELPAPEELRQSWPSFRGPDGSGISRYANVPTSWDGATGEGIAWKTSIPLPGVNSPIVWRDRVFLSGATEERREVYCIDAASGKILWQKDVVGVAAEGSEPPKVNQDTGYAAPTMATDGRFVFAMFATGDLVALDFAGNELWSRSLGVPKNSYGHSTSLTTHNGAVILQFDQGTARDDLSKLLAIDGLTGDIVWEVKRAMPSSWSSPIVIEHDGQPQIITCGDPWVIANSPQDGKEIWRANCFERAEVGPSPVYVDGTVFVANDAAALSAIRADGSGDVTDTHVLWSSDFNMPDTCSPLVTDAFVLLMSFGLLTCYDKNKGGDPLWEEDLGADFTSSPSLVGDRVYLFGLEGNVLIVEPTRDECKRIAEADMGEECVTSPAFQAGSIFIRGKEHLFCIGEPAQSPEKVTTPAGTKLALLPELPAAEEYRQSWPSFRGPDGSGVSSHANVPAEWDGTSGKGILWKTPTPLPGANSPIVWKDRAFLSGATADRREVYCFDTTSGKILWQKEVTGKSPDTGKPIKVNQDTGYAAPTMATDGRLVYAMFATGDVAAFDFSGNEVWSLSLGIPKNNYGHSSSLATHKDRVIVQFDQGSAKDDLSKLLALNGATGETMWEVPRAVPASWCSPIVVEHEGQPQIITCSDPWVFANSADSGEDLWRANCLAPAEVGPSPIYSKGTVFAGNDYAALSAIRAGGSGDVTETHVQWSVDVGLPDTCSPLATDEFVLVMVSYGTLACFDKSEGGDPLWEEDFEADFLSSPSLVGNHVYLFSKEGTAWIVEPTRDECKRIAEAKLGEECATSPAFQDGRIYIRGNEHLFCIGKATTESE
ncbi:MAG: hypothetical protein CMJ64_15330 [Planctomycetaceae bacterium]|nr:hypothetical protein [Planctomycetaceae bacterium]